MTSLEMIARLLLAAGLSSVIGMERERLAWTAGLRTHMLVGVGSCLVILVSAYGFSDALGDHVILDPSRVAAQVVSGVGFLGAGAIILRNDVVKGLTTAASVWAVAGIGLAAGSGLYIPAVAATVIILAILVGLKPLERRYHSSRRTMEVQVRAAGGTMSVGFLETTLGQRAARVRQLIVRPGPEAGRDDVLLVFDRLSARDTAQVLAALRAAPGVSDVEERSS